jgi:hypothetical protein
MSSVLQFATPAGTSEQSPQTTTASLRSARRSSHTSKQETNRRLTLRPTIPIRTATHSPNVSAITIFYGEQRNSKKHAPLNDRKKSYFER